MAQLACLPFPFPSPVSRQDELVCPSPPGSGGAALPAPPARRALPVRVGLGLSARVGSSERVTRLFSARGALAPFMGAEASAGWMEGEGRTTAAASTLAPQAPVPQYPGARGEGWAVNPRAERTAPLEPPTPAASRPYSCPGDMGRDCRAPPDPGDTDSLVKAREMHLGRAPPP